MNVASGNVLYCSIPQWLGGGKKVKTAKNVEFGNIIRSFPNPLCKKIMRNFGGKIQSRIQTSLVFGDVFWK